MSESAAPTVLRRHSRSGRYAPYLFITPYFAIYIAFSLFPIVYTFYISLVSWNGFSSPVFVGFKNYLTLLADRRFFGALTNTLILMLMIIPVQIGLGMFLAVLLSSNSMIGKGSFRLLNFLPYLTTPVALGIIFGIIFDWQFGAINQILSGLGLVKENINWIGKPWPARIMVSLVTIWKYYGYTAVLFIAGITNINPSLYEAAEIDGVNGLQKFAHITVPLLKPTIIFVVLTTMIGCFQIFDEPLMIFSTAGSSSMVGGPDQAVLTGVWMIFDTAFGNILRFGYAATVAYGLFVFIAILTIGVNRLMQRREDLW
jgi:multiple sugar transport system permease protein/cellobiose transport system permease protein